LEQQKSENTIERENATQNLQEMRRKEREAAQERQATFRARMEEEAAENRAKKAEEAARKAQEDAERLALEAQVTPVEGGAAPEINVVKNATSTSSAGSGNTQNQNEESEVPTFPTVDLTADTSPAVTPPGQSRDLETVEETQEEGESPPPAAEDTGMIPDTGASPEEPTEEDTEANQRKLEEEAAAEQAARDESANRRQESENRRQEEAELEEAAEKLRAERESAEREARAQAEAAEREEQEAREAAAEKARVEQEQAALAAAEQQAEKEQLEREQAEKAAQEQAVRAEQEKLERDLAEAAAAEEKQRQIEEDKKEAELKEAEAEEKKAGAEGEGAEGAATPETADGATPDAETTKEDSNPTSRNNDPTSKDSPIFDEPEWDGPPPYEKVSRALLDSHNKLRLNPEFFINLLEEDLKRFRDKVLTRPGKAQFHTYEGQPAWREALDELKKIKPGDLPEFKWDDNLCRAAIDHSNDIAKEGSMSHKGTDGSSMQDRVQRYCNPKAALAENLDFGHWDADLIVLSLFIDDGIKTRGHRKNMINPAHKVLGACVGPHSRHECSSTIVYAGRTVNLKAPAVPPTMESHPLKFSRNRLPREKPPSRRVTVDGSLGDGCEVEEEFDEAMPDWALSVDKKEKTDFKIVAGKETTTKTLTLTYTTKAGTEVKRHIVKITRHDPNGKVAKWGTSTTSGDPKYKFHWG